MDNKSQNQQPKTEQKEKKTGLLSGIFKFRKKSKSKSASTMNKATGDKVPKYREVDSKDLDPNQAISKFEEGLIDVKDLIAPAAIEVDFNHLAMGNKYFRVLFALGYPRFVGPNWLEPLINFESALDISTFYYPVDSKEVMQKIKRKIAEMEATINADLEAGKIVDQNVKVALADAKDLQEQLAKGTEKFFHFALYIMIHADTLKDLDLISKSVESTLGAIGVIVKPATLQQDSGFESTIPACTDKLYVTRNMDTTSIATTFPFVSSELTMDEGIMYGINKHNKSLVVFDRFQIENANTVVFAKSGAGKSYMVKLELLRGLMFGIESIVIDPEQEYQKLCETIGGSYLSFSQDGASKLNPFELSGLYDEGEDELRAKILSLHGLIKLMVGGKISSEEDAILDRALILTYKEKGITPDPATHVNEPPLMEDLYKILKGMAEKEAHLLASKLEKFIKGSASGIFDRKSNIEIDNTFTVFSVRDLSDELRPIAMYMMLEFIWTRIRKRRRKRILVVDEAWWMMQYPDAARFLYSIAKRARKYYLGVTTITQDVEDFLSTDYGKAIVTNSSIQILLKQSPASVDRLQKVFYLSEGEKQYLLSVGVGEGLFFAGSNHVALEVISSANEHKIITSDPAELEQYERERLEREKANEQNKEIMDEAKVMAQTGDQLEGTGVGNLNSADTSNTMSQSDDQGVDVSLGGDVDNINAVLNNSKSDSQQNSSKTVSQKEPQSSSLDSVSEEVVSRSQVASSAVSGLLSTSPESTRIGSKEAEKQILQGRNQSNEDLGGVHSVLPQQEEPNVQQPTTSKSSAPATQGVQERQGLGTDVGAETNIPPGVGETSSSAVVNQEKENSNVSEVEVNDVAIKTVSPKSSVPSTSDIDQSAVEHDSMVDDTNDTGLDSEGVMETGQKDGSSGETEVTIQTDDSSKRGEILEEELNISKLVEKHKKNYEKQVASDANVDSSLGDKPDGGEGHQINEVIDSDSTLSGKSEEININLSKEKSPVGETGAVQSEIKSQHMAQEENKAWAETVEPESEKSVPQVSVGEFSGKIDLDDENELGKESPNVISNSSDSAQPSDKSNSNDVDDNIGIGKDPKKDLELLLEAAKKRQEEEQQVLDKPLNEGLKENLEANKASDDGKFNRNPFKGE